MGTLKVRTAHYRYSGEHRLDVTRAGVDRALKAGQPAPGAPFAPSAAILWTSKAILARAQLLQSAGLTELAQRLHAADFEAYSLLYEAEMRIRAGMVPDSPRWGILEETAWKAGVRPMATAWRALLAQEEVVLVCFCADPAFCHRTILARLLGRFGAEVLGEIVDGVAEQPTQEEPQTTTVR